MASSARASIAWRPASEGANAPRHTSGPARSTGTGVLAPEGAVTVIVTRATPVASTARATKGATWPRSPVAAGSRSAISGGSVSSSAIAVAWRAWIEVRFSTTAWRVSGPLSGPG
ncbi:MAG TPA: hypothetical protein VM889_09970 [Candidatus Thermoplasmatota archaeon]|nr:hypothetical protein [Candidatus Thermoplasmatota archaeon]